ncbi:MAG: GxxExxY protein [Gemmatimonadales bacterium]
MDDGLGDQESFAVIGAAMAVHSHLGAGFLESVYSAALSWELRRRDIPHLKEVRLPVYYRGQQLPVSFRIDFLCFDSLIVEVKAQGVTGRSEFTQVINYLKAAHLNRALLINFGASRLQVRRLAL